jgi:hypothetical protein
MFEPLGNIDQGPQIIYKDHEEHGKGSEYIDRSEALCEWAHKISVLVIEYASYHNTFGQVTIYSPGLSVFVLYINEKSRIRRFIPSTADFEDQVINMSGFAPGSL